MKMPETVEIMRSALIKERRPRGEMHGGAAGVTVLRKRR